MNIHLLMGFFILQLEVVNKNLEAYYDAWDKFVDAWIIIKIKDPSCVYQWRLQVNFSQNHLRRCVPLCFFLLIHSLLPLQISGRGGHEGRW